MDNFVEGVWATFRLLPDEEAILATGGGLHLVLVEGAIRELRRLGETGLTRGLEVSADFLAFRHYTVDRMADTMADVDIGFVGWPGGLDDPTVAGIRGIAHDQGKLVVVTFGSRGVGVFDGRPDGGGDLFVPVTAIPVLGTTLGCGDAFIAGFLESWRQATGRGEPPWSAARRWAPRRPPGAAPCPTRPTARRERSGSPRPTPPRQRGESEIPSARIAVSNSSRVISPLARRSARTARGSRAGGRDFFCAALTRKAIHRIANATRTIEMALGPMSNGISGR